MDNTIQLLLNPDNNTKIFFNTEKKDLGIDFNNIILGQLFLKFYNLQGIKVKNSIPNLIFESFFAKYLILIRFKARVY